MTKLDRTLWLTCTHDELAAKATAILLAAGFTERHVIWSVFETAVDGIRDDLGDWIVRHPDFAAPFAAGNVQFLLGDDEAGEAVYSKGYLNPTWADVLVESERSCRGRGAPELDHVFLEGVEQDGVTADGAALWELVWGS